MVGLFLKDRYFEGEIINITQEIRVSCKPKRNTSILEENVQNSPKLVRLQPLLGLLNCSELEVVFRLPNSRRTERNYGLLLYYGFEGVLEHKTEIFGFENVFLG